MNDSKQWLRNWAIDLDMFAGLICRFLILALVVYWLVVLVTVGFKGPVTYGYGFPVMSPETKPVLVIAGLLLVSLVYNTIATRYFGPQHDLRTLQVIAPRVFVLAFLVLAVGVYFKSYTHASYVPLVLLLAVSAGCTYSAKAGYLSRPPEAAPQPKRVAVTIRDEPAQAHEQVQENVSRVSQARLTFASLYGNESIKQRLLKAGLDITARRQEARAVRNGILLHGAPGNGKTVFAEALAGELDLPFHQLTYADVASKWVGEKSSRVRAAFEAARAAQPCLLFIDEVDSFLESRDSMGSGLKEDRDLVNAMLTLMVDIRHDRVVLVAATNHLDRLDAAGVREGRFDYKVEITPPDEPARIGLLRKGLSENVPGVQVDSSVVEMVAKRWNGFSTKRILAVTEELPNVLQGGKLAVFEDFMTALRQLQGQRGHVPEQGKSLEELVLEPGTRDVIHQLVSRMRDPERTERMGGTLPTGVLFMGPPGTGKTATARALARELQWAFLPSTGAELVRDPKKLEDLYAKAQDLRPTIIFVDEADNLLRSREYSQYTESTNKLLSLMDGVADRVHDVVWIAATNHPDQIDSALMRGGRFTEKVRFVSPSTESLAKVIEGWLKSRAVRLASDLDAQKVAEAIGQESIANVEAVLQAAVNRAIAHGRDPVVLTVNDIDQSVTLVLD